MTQQMQPNGEDDFTIIRGDLQNFNTMKVTPFQIVIRDGVAVSTFKELGLAKKLVRAEQKKGNENIRYDRVLKSAIQEYPGKTKDEITEIIKKELSNAGAKVTSEQ